MQTFITGLAAVGTWVAIVVALFGDKLRSKLLPLRLEIELVDKRGEITDQHRASRNEHGQATTRVARARYYYVVVRNRARIPVAHEVQVMIMSLEVEGPDGRPQIAGGGPLPLGWKHPQLYPLGRTVGDDAIADFFYVLEGKPLEFILPLVPNNFPHKQAPPFKIWVTLQARAIEGTSKPLRLEIAWNGKWTEGAAEMANNLTFN